MTLPDEVYSRLLALRSGWRRFERWSEEQARAAGLTPAQHQLLLAVRGHPDERGPTIGEVADYLGLRHHSTVGLVDRADAAGLVVRVRSEEDRRIVRLHLTDTGEERLAALSALHIQELERLAHQLPGRWEGDTPPQATHGLPFRPSTIKSHRGTVAVARVYEPVVQDRSHRVLVDRLWPRGIARHAAPFEVWAKDVAPSAALSKWYGHVPERFDEFARRYGEELRTAPACDALEDLRRQASDGEIVLVTAAKELDHSAATALKDVLTRH